MPNDFEPTSHNRLEKAISRPQSRLRQEIVLRKARKTRAREAERAKQEDLSHRLHAALGIESSSGVLRCAAELIQRLHKTDRPMNACVVQLMYGGGKDSSYMAAFMRAVQLAVRRILGVGFKLRLVTFRHNGMPAPVMRNIDTVYKRLEFYGDADVELLLVDGEDIRTFGRDLELPEIVREENRRSFVMSAHLSRGDARASHCDACNAGMVRAFSQGATYGAPADLIVTGDSLAEQLRYAAWARHTAVRFGVDKHRSETNLAATLGRLDQLQRVHDAVTFGVTAPVRPPLHVGANGPPEFFSIYPYTSYELGAHRAFVMDWLGFVLDDLAWGWTESDCARPFMMALARGLLFERVRGGTFAEGAAEYIAFALSLMAKKRYPADLIAQMKSRYDGPDGPARLRAHARTYMEDAYGIDERQLTATLFSPFTDQGARLSAWIAAEAPELAPHEQALREFGDGEREIGASLANELRRLTSLEPAEIAHLWRSKSTPNLADSDAATSPLAFVRQHDPHRAAILSRQADGTLRREVISGR